MRRAASKAFTGPLPSATSMTRSSPTYSLIRASVRNTPSSRGTLPVTSTDPDLNVSLAKASVPEIPLREVAWGSWISQEPHQISEPATVLQAELGAVWL